LSVVKFCSKTSPVTLLHLASLYLRRNYASIFMSVHLISLCLILFILCICPPSSPSYQNRPWQDLHELSSLMQHIRDSPGHSRLSRPFATLQAIRDSPGHPQQTMPCPPVTAAAPSPKRKVTCTCCGVFKPDRALQQHQRDSPLHSRTNTVKGTSGIQCSCGSWPCISKADRQFPSIFFVSIFIAMGEAR
jgi:hypothetical protein